MRRVVPLHFGAFVICLAQFVDHFVVLAEIEAAPLELGIAIFKDAAKFADRFVEKTVLLVYKPIEPRDGPPWRGWLELRRPLQRLNRLFQPPFLQINARQIYSPIGAAKIFDVFEGLRRLNQLALLRRHITFKQQADAVIIPALPPGNVGSLRGDRGLTLKEAFGQQIDDAPRRRLAADGEPGTVKAQLLRAQQLGNYQLVTAQCDGHVFKAKIEPHLRVSDGPVWLRLAAPETVFFSNDERIAISITERTSR